ncbi:hypothetical protein AXF42_Ash013408 [Apostasia shenzhenica]|uniref:RRM domain-containing protein n=1 Tax=Apostasia shenzhenica TaxID=1088818 RepID=A0A2I0A456_9ASPA|nr:hypothetical protein AXF42_Ash013408 [Apostasia shenzhenica]
MAEIDGNHNRVDLACPPRKKMKGEAELYERKRTVLVGNLPCAVKDEELYQLFCSLDQSETNVQAVRVIVRDPNTTIEKGFAYVLFKTREAAKLRLQEGRPEDRGPYIKESAMRNKTPPFQTRKEIQGLETFHNKLSPNTSR